VINERAAKMFWQGQDPIGKTDHDDDRRSRPFTVVGIAADAKQSDWAAKIAFPEIYLPARQSGTFLGEPGSHSDYLTLVGAHREDPAAMANAVKQTVWSFDKNLPISEVLTMDSVVAEANASASLRNVPACHIRRVALVLASVGIYGVMSYAWPGARGRLGFGFRWARAGAACCECWFFRGWCLALVGGAAGCGGGSNAFEARGEAAIWSSAWRSVYVRRGRAYAGLRGVVGSLRSGTASYPD